MGDVKHGGKSRSVYYLTRDMTNVNTLKKKTMFGRCSIHATIHSPRFTNKNMKLYSVEVPVNRWFGLSVIEIGN